ncbi:DUF1640 domain-containing protein [Pseudomonas gingeri]|uniref:DUF1640 domain-containing protein n=1 Tax=Pseudomonas gingeri TaxID=117681 RepID=UPI0015A38A85|nr:DUF1640 domain-containing protein [Pseudomonas gingeri]NWA28585.1 DUF1640 domain-containing protein [Pseudomonas gingeri]
MTLAITIYDALTTANVPPDKAKAVVHAWEAEVEKLASKADLKQVETHLTQAITNLGVELRAELKEQRAEQRSSTRILQWSIGVTFLCVSAPFIRSVLGV